MNITRKLFLVLGLYCLGTLFQQSWAIGGADYVSSSSVKNGFALSVKDSKTTLYVDANDWKGVIRALNDLKMDVGKVTGFEPAVSEGEVKPSGSVVLVGTLGKSKLIDEVVQSGKVDVSSIKGKWENFIIQVVDNPVKGVGKALVIIGSDKRGTIYGIYDISEKIGVSPWYWWSDVPVKHSDNLYIKPGRYQEGPSVKYRGIFLNDEAPALSGWISFKYGQVAPRENPPVGRNVANYGKEFYTKIFELLLRIKGNYLWPAMWGNAFNEDDLDNPRLADEYGIVMGTSHQEPMVRSQQEWDRRYFRTLGAWDYKKHPDVMQDFWREGIRRNKDYESVVTMGLRGANDSEMKGELKDNISMVEGIIQTQQKILTEEMKRPIDEIPQTWCLYKEILDYYNEGMKVPDNMILLWPDDNWGNVRRLPSPEERKRKGGAGVYYHFDYHGGPRSYEWINTNPLPKIWDQMHLAKEYGADQIWVVNVGHFRGYELPMEYFMNLAWNTDRWKNDNVTEYTRKWAAREFGGKYANDIADILSKYGKYNNRRKPESLSTRIYSLINYGEADKVVADYKAISDKAEKIGSLLPKEYEDAFYHLVLFPAKIGAVVNDLYVTASKSQLYGRQGRVSANWMADKTRELFSVDTAMMTYYNTVYAGGRWNHFMDQTHLGYTSWNPPRRNSLNAIQLPRVTPLDAPGLGVAIEGTDLAWPASTEKAVLPEFDPFTGQKRWVELFNRGNVSYSYTIKSDVSWLIFSDATGTIDQKDKRIWLKLDESKLPVGKSEGHLVVSGAGGEVVIQVKAFKPESKILSTLNGFVESDGMISIEPEHCSKNIVKGDRKWLLVDDYGNTLSGMRATAPADAPSAIPGKDAPCLEYPLYFFSKGTFEVNFVTSPLLNYMPGRDIRFAVSLNGAKAQYVVNVTKDYGVNDRTWGPMVQSAAKQSKATIEVPTPGAYTLKVWMVDPGVLIQKILVDAGGLKTSYLGPEESPFYQKGKRID
jgi:hypothetical protein